MVLSNLTNYMSNYVRFQAFLAVPYVLLKPEVVRFWQRRSLLECWWVMMKSPDLAFPAVPLADRTGLSAVWYDYERIRVRASEEASMRALLAGEESHTQMMVLHCRLFCLPNRLLIAGEWPVSWDSQSNKARPCVKLFIGLQVCCGGAAVHGFCNRTMPVIGRGRRCLSERQPTLPPSPLPSPPPLRWAPRMH